MLEITISLLRADPKTGTGTESYIFDPPGSTGGSEPLGCGVYF